MAITNDWNIPNNYLTIDQYLTHPNTRYIDTHNDSHCLKVYINTKKIDHDATSVSPDVE